MKLRMRSVKWAELPNFWQLIVGMQYHLSLRNRLNTVVYSEFCFVVPAVRPFTERQIIFCAASKICEVLLNDVSDKLKNNNNIC